MLHRSYLAGVPSSLVVFAVLVLASAASAAAEPEANATRPDGTKNRAAWMAQGSFGVMTHYLVKPKGNTPGEKTADLNRIVDQFDMDGYVRQFQETGADWLIFTLGQCTQYLCSPNSLYEARLSGHTSSRDLLLELAGRLKAINKRLIVYFPSENEPAVKQVLDSGDGKYPDAYFDFLREYSLKLGTMHHGWWFDACGPHPDEYWNKWFAAVRAGNPDAAIAFSGAEFCCGAPLGPICKLADYHAGEIHLLENGKIRRDFLPPGGDIVVVDGKLRKRGQEAGYYLPDGPFVGGVQWHALLPIDLTFNPAVPNQFCHYTDKELIAFVRAVKSVGGAVTINVPIDVETGHIPDDSHAQLVRLSKALGK